MNPITCPKCRGPLKSVAYRDVEVNRCLRCSGLWFDSLEIEQLKTIHGSESLDVGNPLIGRQLNRIEQEISCPKCGTIMMRMLDIDRYSIWYEKCPHCQGVWLDAGEFKKFKQNFKLRRRLSHLIASPLKKTWSKLLRKIPSKSINRS